jgi:phospholipid N-methyltransferase
MNHPPSSILPKTSPEPPSPKGKRPDWWLMFTKFLQHGRAIASFSPSSKFLARKICKGIDFDKANCIVELGAGTGPITAELLKQVKPHTRVLVVERDHDFCVRLRERFPAADIVEADAANFEQMLDERGIHQVDHILSGLPLPSFPAPLRDSILAAVAKRLHADGSFRQLSVMPLIYWKLYRRYFNEVHFKFVPLNLPPAGVYVCRGYNKTKA